MKMILMRLAVVGVVLLSSVCAQAALTITSVDGDWSNHVGGYDVKYPNGVALSVPYGNNSEDQVRWGEPATGEQSGLGFTGVAAPDKTIEVDKPFDIGQLRHFNHPITLGTHCSSVDLGVTMVFDGGDTGTFDFTFDIDETDNSPGPPASDDIIDFQSASTHQTVDIDGTTYTLQLLGFGDTSSSLISSFRSSEGRTNSTLLWGKITTHTIPAPGAILLAGLGAGFVGWLRRGRVL